jgi:hypothetical protein
MDYLSIVRYRPEVHIPGMLAKEGRSFDWDQWLREQTG